MPNGYVTIEELKELEEENGVETKLWDHARDVVIHVKYYYKQVDEKWLHWKHDIMSAAPIADKGSTKIAVN